MSGQVVPKRFGLKYSPKPAIALEYQKPDSGLAILEVAIEQLSPGTYDVEGVVDALQKNHPAHLGPNMVSAEQLERLVTRLLFEGRAHLPEEYPTPTRMIVEEEPQRQPSSFASSLIHEPPTKPSLLPKAEELSGSLSAGPTPAPTPEVQRTTRDPSDGSSATSEPQSPGGSGVDDVGAEEERYSAAGNTSNVQRASSDDDEGPHLPATTAVNAAVVATFLGDREVGSWDDDEEKSRGEVDEELGVREREGKEREQAHGGARDIVAAEEAREGVEESPSLEGAPSEPDVKYKVHETLEKDNEDFHDHGRLDDETEGFGQHRNDERKMEPQHTSPESFITAAAATTTLNGESERQKSAGDPSGGENGTGKERPEKEKEGGQESDEDEVSEIEEEDDDIPEDVESEELYESGSSHGERKDDEGHADHGDDNGAGSKGDGSEKKVDNAENNRVDSSTSSNSVGIAEGTAGSINRVDDRTENERASPRATAEEESDVETPSPPPVAPPLQTSPTPASPAAPADTTLASQGSSEEHNNSLSLSSPLAPSRRLAPPAPASPEARVGLGASPLAGLPLPPMGGAHQRLGLLGSLAPVGGRGLPSLALPMGKKTLNMRSEEGDGGGGVGRAGGGETEGDGKEATGVTDPLVPGRASSLLSPGLPATRSAVAEEGPSAVPEPLHLSLTGGGGAQEKGIRNDTAADNDGDGGDALNELARLPLTTRSEEEGKEEEHDKKEEEAALRARLGFGQDEYEEEEEDERQVEDGDDGDDGEGSLGGKKEKGVLSSPLGSPKQHQGQEEENAGRISPPNPRGEEDEGAPIVSGAGGDYFGDSDEASSVGEDMSFEQESVEGDGGGDGTGSDDYFS